MIHSPECQPPQNQYKTFFSEFVQTFFLGVIEVADHEYELYFYILLIIMVEIYVFLSN